MMRLAVMQQDKEDGDTGGDTGGACKFYRLPLPAPDSLEGRRRRVLDFQVVE